MLKIHENRFNTNVSLRPHIFRKPCQSASKLEFTQEKKIKFKLKRFVS